MFDTLMLLCKMSNAIVLNFWVISTFPDLTFTIKCISESNFMQWLEKGLYELLVEKKGTAGRCLGPGPWGIGDSDCLLAELIL